LAAGNTLVIVKTYLGWEASKSKSLLFASLSWVCRQAKPACPQTVQTKRKTSPAVGFSLPLPKKGRLCLSFFAD
jgi:hypothetical protein